MGRWAARRSARTRLRSGRRGCRAKRAPSKDHRLADVQVGRWMTEAAAAAEVVKSWGVGAALACRPASWSLAASCRHHCWSADRVHPFLRGLPVAGTRVRGDRAADRTHHAGIARRVPPRAGRGAGNPQTFMAPCSAVTSATPASTSRATRAAGHWTHVEPYTAVGAPPTGSGRTDDDPWSDHRRRRRRQRPASTSTSGAPASHGPWPRTPPLSLTSRPRSPSFPAQCGAPA